MAIRGAPTESRASLVGKKMPLQPAEYRRLKPGDPKQPSRVGSQTNVHVALYSEAINRNDLQLIEQLTNDDESNKLG